jgi:hypothetical protein
MKLSYDYTTVFRESPDATGFSRAPLRIGDLFVFAVPLLQFFQVRLIGTLYGTDLLLLAALPLVLPRGLRRLQQKQVIIVLALGLLWLFAQVVTDLMRESPPEDYLRGWSKIALTVTHFATLWLLFRSSLRRFTLYGFGICIGGILSCLINPTDFFTFAPWKFGYATPVTLGLVLLISYFPKRYGTFVSVTLLLGMSALNLYLNFRSLALVCLLSAIYSHFRTRMRVSRRKTSVLQISLILVIVILSIVGFQEIYMSAAENGWLGVDAQSKLRDQTGAAGILLGGRSEILASGQAIIDSPIIGHGSWAKDPQYAAIMDERKAELGYKKARGDDSDLIPTHSYIFGAWVEAGIAGAVFWLWILYLAVTMLLRTQGSATTLFQSSFIAFLLCWNIVFSPYGAEQRFATTYFIVAIIMFRSMCAKRSEFRMEALPN